VCVSSVYHGVLFVQLWICVCVCVAYLTVCSWFVDCVCVCVCARARARARVCVRLCVRVSSAYRGVPFVQPRMCMCVSEVNIVVYRLKSSRIQTCLLVKSREISVQ